MNGVCVSDWLGQEDLGIICYIVHEVVRSDERGCGGLLRGEARLLGTIKTETA